MAGKKKQAPRMRLSPEQRDRFLEVLGQTGNRRFAAEAIGVEPRLMDQRREFDPLLDRQWEEALDQADRRLAGAAGPFDCAGGRELNVIKRGRGGRTQIVASGPKRWNRGVEDRFLSALGMCGNIAAAARSVGFSESSVWHRRAKWPEFARAMEEVLEQAEVRIEFRMAAMGSDLAAAALSEGGKERPSAAPAGSGQASPGTSEAPPFDRDFALRFLKWREEKRQGRSKRPRGGSAAREPSIGEVKESILRKIDAIERHRNAERLGQGWVRDENGYMIPPGWVRREE